MKSIFRMAWDRFGIIGSVVGHVQGRVLITGLYFTLAAPFALLARLFTGPLTSKSEPVEWLSRPPVPADIDSARDQG